MGDERKANFVSAVVQLEYSIGGKKQLMKEARYFRVKLENGEIVLLKSLQYLLNKSPQKTLRNPIGIVVLLRKSTSSRSIKICWGQKVKH